MSRLLAPLAAGFKLGVAIRRAAYRRGWFKSHRLNRPVVSVGNLTAGGTGKTPIVRYIAEILLKSGWRPSILTRGYGRRDGGKMIVLEPAAERKADPGKVGDEPALLAQSLPELPIMVCTNRYRAGRLAEERFDVNVHILDDGFQHWALARDVDVVLLDVTQELSDQALLPAGRQREPCSALERAHIVVLTRTELGDPQPLEDRVREISPNASIFHCSTRLCELVDIRNGRVFPPTAFNGEPVHAFCGIGNPRAFFADLRKWGMSLVSETSFSDHVVYRNREADRHIAGMLLTLRLTKSTVAAFVTTEKDVAKLTKGVKSPVPVLACVIRSEIHEAAEFEETLISHLEAARERN